MPPVPRRRPRSSLKARRAETVQDCVETLNEIFRQVDVFSKHLLRNFGVSGPQLWALRAIRDAGTVTMGGLAARMHLHVSTVTGIIDRLQLAGLVTRTRSETDRRILHLAVTAKGRGIVLKAPEPPRSLLARGLEKLGQVDLSRMKTSLDQLAGMMGVAVPGP